jgi:hypothetical protein
MVGGLQKCEEEMMGVEEMKGYHQLVIQLKQRHVTLQ